MILRILGCAFLVLGTVAIVYHHVWDGLFCAALGLILVIMPKTN
ncbi:hypothetical protein [Occallatibacter savannae]|nr:hypothetical protein [Occallatibacter savannae]